MIIQGKIDPTEQTACRSNRQGLLKLLRGIPGDRYGKARHTAVSARLSILILLSVGAESVLARPEMANAPAPTGSESFSTETHAMTLPESARAPSPVPVPVRARAVRVVSFAADGSTLMAQPLFGTVDQARFSALAMPEPQELVAPFTLAGIGFPHIEITPSTARKNRREFKPLLDWRNSDVPLARVRCMGLSSRAVARRAARYAPAIEELASLHGLAPSLVMAVVARESCFDPAALSHAGAIGLMQLMPATARELREGDPRHPMNNLRAGVRYLAAMHERFGTVELALAAYNAGPGNVRRYGGIPPFSETRIYVRKVLAYQRRYEALSRVASL